jgi:hypothetical protein
MKRVLVLLLAASCSDEVSQNADAAVRTEDAAIGGYVELGGGFMTFEPLSDGQNVALIRGPQGGGALSGYHIWTSIRLRDYGIGAAEVDLDVKTADNNEARALAEYTLSFEDNGDFEEALGLAPRIDDCCKVATKAVRIHAVIFGPDGVFGEDILNVIAGECLDENNVSICP